PGEARAVALCRIGEQRELRDDERRSARVEERAVELALVVLEDPEPRDLAGEPRRLGGRVPAGDAQEHAKAGADLTTGRCAGPADALDDRLHGGIFAAGVSGPFGARPDVVGAFELHHARRVLLRPRPQ